MGALKKYIRLVDTQQLDNRITFTFLTDLDCFCADSFYVDYADKMLDAPESIKNIVFAAVMAPVCWATGARLELPCLDSVYIKALEGCKQYFYDLKLRNWSFQEEIVTRPVENKGDPQVCGLLFSGGVDALTSYIKHRDERLDLFTIIGLDVPLDQVAHIKRCEDRIRAFADGRGLSCYFIYTNIHDCFLFERLRKFSTIWYSEVSHSMLLTGLTAPISFPRLNKLYIASTHSINHKNLPMWGSNHILDNRICWAGAHVIYDNGDLSRLQKIEKYLKGFPEIYKYVRVCWAQSQEYNCKKCEKCMRTVIQLLMSNIDPAACNFPIDKNTLPQLKKKLISYIGYHKFFSGSEDVLNTYWISSQSMVEIDKLEDIYGSREFFQWFKETKVLKRKFNPLLLSFLGWGFCVKSALLKILNK